MRCGLRHGSIKGPQFSLVFVHQRQMQRVATSQTGLPTIQHVCRHAMVIVINCKPYQSRRHDVDERIDRFPCTGPHRAFYE